jgi:alkylation response protein AidB-like acyl-CoA dehydrogenase
VIDELRSQRSAPFAGHAVPARRLIALAGERGAAADPAIRQGLARYYTLTELNRFTQLRTASAARAGQAPGPEASISKLAIGQVCDLSSELSFAILGPNGMLAGPDAPYEGSLHDVALAAPGVHIGGGTDQIQRTTIAERSLGLPREPDPDHDQPWRKAKR